MSDYQTTYRAWLESDKVSLSDKDFLTSIKDDELEIKKRFSSYMSFGTAGLRSTMGPGTAMMNVYTVAHTTQAIALLIIEENGADKGVAIAYDSRNNSELFAKTAASVLAANGIKVYIFESIRPTPELSFALLYHGCIAGINITASHNPKEYNGYKVYWSDGAQLPVNHAETVTAKAAGIDIFADVKTTDFDMAVSSGIVTVIGKEVDEAYLASVEAQAVNKSSVTNVADTFKVVYSPLHGAGYRLVPEILSRIGVKNLYTVSEQMIPDGNFPTVDKPNPEYPATFALGKELAIQNDCDLIIATDPDADRLAATARKKDGEFVTFTGNQMGLLLLDYIITAYKEKGTMPTNPFAVKSLVSSYLADKICEENGVHVYNVLTGFKYIGEMIKLHDGKDGHFIFGFEESCGYLKGTYTRDKDAIVAAMLVCEMAAHHSAHGKTLYDALQDIYSRYGYSFERTEELSMDGIDAMERQTKLMKYLRDNKIHQMGHYITREMGDLLDRRFYNIREKTVTPSPFPKSNVIIYKVENGDTIIIRPSGTEPKVKLYYLITAANHNDAVAKYAGYKTTMNDTIQRFNTFIHRA